MLLQLKFETSFPGSKLLFRKRSFDPEKEVLSLSTSRHKKRRSWKQSFEFELCNIKLGTRFRFPTQSLDPETKDKKQITLLCFYSWLSFIVIHKLYVTNTAREGSKYGAFSGPYFPVFVLNTGKYRPEKTPYLDAFYAMKMCWKLSSRTMNHADEGFFCSSSKMIKSDSYIFFLFYLSPKASEATISSLTFAAEDNLYQVSWWVHIAKRHFCVSKSLTVLYLKPVKDQKFMQRHFQNSFKHLRWSC